MDSELVARQISGIYRVKHPDLKPIHAAVMEMLARFDGYTVGHVPRALNKDADRLSNVAIDGLGSGLTQRSNDMFEAVYTIGPWRRLDGRGRIGRKAALEESPSSTEQASG